MDATRVDNFYADLPTSLPDELVNVVTENSHVRIERIVSTGQSSPAGFWYDQDEHEWVILLKGEAKLHFEDGRCVQMTAGDHILIPAHQKHRVEWSTPHETTVWLAVFYRNHQ